MRRLAVLLVALATTWGGSLVSAGSASALGGEWLGCRVLPASTNTFSDGCSNSRPATSYEVTFAVQNGTASSTYSWSRPSNYPVTSGCSSTQNWCSLSVPGRTFDQTLTVTVTLTQGTASETLTTQAWIGAYCNGQPC
jgi:hypothetical protein